jgi:Tfp pilus assembly protein PilX
LAIKLRYTRIGNNRGIVLVLAAFFIAALSLIGMGANKNVIMDTAISSNYLSSLQSFYVAEAGLERGKLEAAEQLVANGWVDFSPLINGSGVTSMTGVSFGNGTQNSYKNGSTFALRFDNDGAETSATVDGNRTIKIASEGKLADTSCTTKLEATIKMNTLPPLPGSVNLVNDANVTISGNSFLINGNDHLSDGSMPGLTTARLGIALCNTAQTVSDVLAGIKHPLNITGSGSTPSIGTSTQLTEAMLVDYVNTIKSIADYKNVLTFGTAAYPKITYYDAGDVAINKTDSLDGAGILVVNGHDLTCNGNVHWKGVIIVLGGKFRFNGGGSGNNITGGLIVGGPVDISPELDMNGGIDIVYSQQAINQVNNALTGNQGKWNVLSWRRVN